MDLGVRLGCQDLGVCVQKDDKWMYEPGLTSEESG